MAQPSPLADAAVSGTVGAVGGAVSGFTGLYTLPWALVIVGAYLFATDDDDDDALSDL